MLSRLARRSGEPLFGLTLIVDTTALSGAPLWYSCIAAHLTNAASSNREILLVVVDDLQLVGAVSEIRDGNLYDCSRDPAGWLRDSSRTDSSRSFLDAIASIAARVAGAVPDGSSKHSVCVFIDGLATALLRHGVVDVCRALRALCAASATTEVVAWLHADVLPPSSSLFLPSSSLSLASASASHSLMPPSASATATTSATPFCCRPQPLLTNYSMLLALESLATTIISIRDPPPATVLPITHTPSPTGGKGGGSFATTPTPTTITCDIMCSILHRRRTGKRVAVTVEYAKVYESPHHLLPPFVDFFTAEQINPPAPPPTKPAPVLADKAAPISEAQRLVAMPYLQAQHSTPGGTVINVDDDEDYDDEDPDEDLGEF